MKTVPIVLAAFLYLPTRASSLEVSRPPAPAGGATSARRRFFAGCSSALLSPMIVPPSASGAAASVPLVGRFEPPRGASSFLGSWNYEATAGIPRGVLSFLKNGEVELLRYDDPKLVLAVGAVPWKYVSPKGSDTFVTVTFTLDEDGEDDVLIFSGVLDSAAGPDDRVMEGSISTGRAEIGARGGGPMRKAGSFRATFRE
uniref:Uncharacterized protein n=1 Tax=Corethron hystrix TaxID=216773 RepID=A0A7S1FUC2_9STRA|mmetsp:Transcript_2988/g.5597  ORF Transcript_2988/g.5597 Transcript_2988/m.5597 type:complete len:200 (+) Transcript_2988:41-640(+)